MKYLAIALRLLILIIGVKILMIEGWDISTASSLSGIAFVFIAVYFGLMSLVWEASLACPFFTGCRKK